MAAPPPTPPPRLAPLEAQDPTSIPPFEVKGRLGAGGMGIVYGAVAPDGAWVAIKVIREEYTADPGFRARFSREIDLVQRVRARCIAPVLAAQTSVARPWYATAFVPGPTLSERVGSAGALSLAQARVLAVGMAEAIAAIHAAGVVHRDLKPANVILADDGPKVLDFGIARAVDETALTGTGQLVGSPGWVSPERFRGDSGPEADVFSWGALVAYATTGRPPFGAGSAETLLYRVLHESPDLGGVPQEFAEPVARALAKDPAQRPTPVELARWCSTEEHSDTLEVTRLAETAIARHWHAPGAAAAPPPPDQGGYGALNPPPSASAKPSRKRPLLVLGAAVTVLVLGAAIGTWALTAEDEPEQAAPSAPGNPDQEAAPTGPPEESEPAPGTEVEPLRFAMLLPQSGPTEHVGESATAAIALALADINEAGGVNGQELPEVEEVDEGQDPAETAQAADELMHGDADVVLGPSVSGSVSTVADRFADADLLMCSGSADAPEISDMEIELFFRTVPAWDGDEDVELSDYDPPADFEERLSDSEDGVEDFPFSAHYYDCVVAVALAVESVQSTEAGDIAEQMRQASPDAESCSSFAECRDLVEEGTDVHYQGVSGPIAFDDNGDVIEDT